MKKNLVQIAMNPLIQGRKPKNVIYGIVDLSLDSRLNYPLPFCCSMLLPQIL